MGIGNPIHLMFIAAIALIVLGPKRLPELARSLGHGMREFRDSMSEAVSGEERAQPSAVPGQAQLLAASAEPLAGSSTEPVAVVSEPPANASEPIVDPAQPVPSGDAPDSRPL
jgi:sec-independent protein translocase protein TatA